MQVSRRRLAALLAAGLLAAPAPALGQSAGDDQYQDPFAPEEQPEPSGGDEPVDSDTEPAPAAPAEPAPEPAPAATGQEPAAAEGQPAPTGQPELPRTGVDVGAVLLAGAVLLTGGIALRVRLRA